MHPSRSLFAEQIRWWEDPASVPDMFCDYFFEPALIRFNENFMVLTMWRVLLQHISQVCLFYVRKRLVLCFLSKYANVQCKWFASEMHSGSEGEQMIEVISFRTSTDQSELVTDFENRGKRNRLPSHLMSMSFFRFALI